MANFFKSTLSNLMNSTLLGGGGSSAAGQPNRHDRTRNYSASGTDQVTDLIDSNHPQNANDDFLGRKLDLGGKHHFVVRKKIGSGGFSSVYQAKRSMTCEHSENRNVAIKRMYAGTDDQRERILQESRLWKLASRCEFIVDFIACAELTSGGSGNHLSEYVIVCEYCELGQLSDYIKPNQPRHYSIVQAVSILYQQTSALYYLHNKLNPPLIHRDVKLENFLLTRQSNGKVHLKLCDFGSATDKQLRPSKEWTSMYRGLVEEDALSVTTPAYRPPELLNTYDEGVLGCPMDMWALGCCFYQESLWLEHPFLDCAKLRIINADFKLPPTCDRFTASIIEVLLTPDPSKRLTASGLMDMLFQRNVSDTQHSFSNVYHDSNIEATSLDFLILQSTSSPSSICNHPFSSNVIQNEIVKVTTRLGLLTSATCPVVQSDCFVISNIMLCYDWFFKNFPLVIDHAFKRSYTSILLHSSMFGRTVVAAASLFARFKLCKQPDQFLHFLENLIEQQRRLSASFLIPNAKQRGQSPSMYQKQLSASSKRYLDYMFQSPLHRKCMFLKQIEILPGNDPFATAIYSVDGVSGKERLLSKSEMSNDWQRDVHCSFVGDILIRIYSKQMDRLAEVRFNTMFVPVTECEIGFDSADIDQRPYGQIWIESLILDFMFTPEDGKSATNVETAERSNTSSDILHHLVSNEKELKSLKEQLKSASSSCSKFFVSPNIGRTYGLSTKHIKSHSFVETLDEDMIENNNIWNQKLSGNIFEAADDETAPTHSQVKDDDLMGTHLEQSLPEHLENLFLRESNRRLSRIDNYESAISSNNKSLHSKTSINKEKHHSSNESRHTDKDLLEEFFEITVDNNSIRGVSNSFTKADQGKPTEIYPSDLLGDSFVSSDHKASANVPDMKGSISEQDFFENEKLPRSMPYAQKQPDCFQKPSKANKSDAGLTGTYHKSQKVETSKLHFANAEGTTKRDPFEDLFAEVGGGVQSSHKPMSLVDLRNLQQQKSQNEPALVKVREWKSAGNQDIAVLLSTLHQVIPLQANWSPVSLSIRSQHRQSDEVKKCYRKALLLVHPDKNTARGLPAIDKEVCRLIFIEISEAWAKYTAKTSSKK